MTIKTILKEFDIRFGSAGPEKDSDSVGRHAGCDDCSSNIELREEHREFLRQTLLDYQESLARKCEARQLTNTKEESDSDWFYGFGYNHALSYVAALIRSNE